MDRVENTPGTCGGRRQARGVVHPGDQRLLGQDMEARVEESLRRAALWEEVKDNLKGPGLGLSGGQQQRLCVARGIAVKPDQIRMAARRRADVDEVELFAPQQFIDRVEPPAVGTGGEKGVPARVSGVGRSDDPYIFARAPAGHVPIGRNIAKADERAPQHCAPSAFGRQNLRRLNRPHAQSSPNLCAIAAKD